MLKVKRVLNEISRFFLLILFTGYIGVISFYTHVHVVDGVTIVHSHPFKKAVPGQPLHSHSPAGFQLIHSVSSFSSTSDVVFQVHFGTYAKAVSAELKKALEFVFLEALPGTLFLRAPPVRG